MTIYVRTFPPRRRWSEWRAEAERWLAVNVRDEGEAYVLTAFVPGVKAEDLKIQVVDDTVAIEGHYPKEEREYLLCELPSGSFQRILRLPTSLDANAVEATLEQGVLTLRLPKAASVRPRTIQVKAR
ncbi:MAG: Hsp20/alpha crystallin family protein [Anaerolineales bacterium]